MAEYIDKFLVLAGLNLRLLRLKNEYENVDKIAELENIRRAISETETADVVERAEINKAITEIKELYTEWENSTDDARLESNPYGAVLNIIQRNIGE